MQPLTDRKPDLHCQITYCELHKKLAKVCVNQCPIGFAAILLQMHMWEIFEKNNELNYLSQLKSMGSFFHK